MSRAFDMAAASLRTARQALASAAIEVDAALAALAAAKAENDAGAPEHALVDELARESCAQHLEDHAPPFLGAMGEWHRAAASLPRGPVEVRRPVTARGRPLRDSDDDVDEPAPVSPTRAAIERVGAELGALLATSDPHLAVTAPASGTVAERVSGAPGGVHGAGLDPLQTPANEGVSGVHADASVGAAGLPPNGPSPTCEPRPRRRAPRRGTTAPLFGGKMGGDHG